MGILAPRQARGAWPSHVDLKPFLCRRLRVRPQTGKHKKRCAVILQSTSKYLDAPHPKAYAIIPDGGDYRYACEAA